MRRWFGRLRRLSFCESCGSICDSSCRSLAARERVLAAEIGRRAWL